LDALERVQLLGGKRLDGVHLSSPQSFLVIARPSGRSNRCWRLLRRFAPRNDRTIHSRMPIHVTGGWACPAAAFKTISLMRRTSGTVTSRPPKPQMNPTTGGRVAAGYNEARISVASTPLMCVEPNE